MSTAVLYSGQARTIAQCLPTQHWHVFRHFPGLHFFIVWQKTPDAVAGVKLLEDKYGKERVHSKLIDDPTDLPLIPLKYGAYAPYSNMNVPHKQLMMQHWYQNEVGTWFDKWGSEVFTTIIRMRGDLFFHRFDDAPTEAGDRVCYSPWWGRFGGVADRFAVMGREASRHYFTVFQKIQKLLDAGCPFHPESLLKASLDDGGILILDTLRAEFSTRREDGTDRRWESEVGPDVSQFVR